MNKHKLLCRSKTRVAETNMYLAAVQVATRPTGLVVQLRYKLTPSTEAFHPLGSEPMLRIFIRAYLYCIPQLSRLIRYFRAFENKR